MNLSRKLIAICAMTAMLFSSAPATAQEYCVDNGGCGYTDCCRTSSLAPAIALGTIALVAVVVVMLQNTSGSAHCHNHN